MLGDDSGRIFGNDVGVPPIVSAWEIMKIALNNSLDTNVSLFRPSTANIPVIDRMKQLRRFFTACPVWFRRVWYRRLRDVSSLVPALHLTPEVL